MAQASTVGRLFTADREVTGCGTTFLPHRTGFTGELLPCYERARDAVSRARPHSKDPLMFNVSVRKIVVSTLAIAAPIAFSSYMHHSLCLNKQRLQELQRHCLPYNYCAKSCARY